MPKRTVLTLASLIRNLDRIETRDPTLAESQTLVETVSLALLVNVPVDSATVVLHGRFRWHGGYSLFGDMNLVDCVGGLEGCDGGQDEIELHTIVVWEFFCEGGAKGRSGYRLR